MADNAPQPAPNILPSGAKQRPRNPENWRQNKAKKLRNLGEAYVSPRTQKAVAARQVGPQCSCKWSCFQKIGEADIKELFDDFWKLGCYDLQNAYLHKQVTNVEVKRSRVKEERFGRRQNSRVYHVTIRQISVQVCMKAFLSIHGISEKRVRSVKSKASESGSAKKDARGSTNKLRILERVALVNKHVRTNGVGSEK